MSSPSRSSRSSRADWDRKGATPTRAVRSSGTVYPGCNLENAALSGISAERAAVARAVTDGEREFAAIAIVGGPQGADPDALCFPCGVCRQMLFEFGGRDLRVIVGSPEASQVYVLGDLLPHAFGPEALAPVRGGDRPSPQERTEEP